MPKETNVFGSKIEEWGKTKFKPTLKATTRTSQNPFTKTQNFSCTGDNEIGNFNRGGFNGRHHRGGKFNGSNNRGRGGRFNGKNNKSFGQNNRGTGKYQKDKNDRVRFNPTARDVKPDIATPWTKFKDEINHKQREDTQAALQANMDTVEAKNVLKQREIIYRRLLMEQKKRETTQWEDFGENDLFERDNWKMKQSKQNSIPKEQFNTEYENMESNKKIDNECKVANIDKHDKPVPNEQNHNNFKRKAIHSEEAVEIDGGNITNTKNKKKKKPNTNIYNDSNEQTKITRTQLENTEGPETTDEGSSRKRIKKMHLHKNRNNTISEENGANDDKFIKKDCKGSKPLLSNDDLTNFNANNLSFKQKDAFRRIITKSVTYKMGTSLEQCLENRKYQVSCKTRKNKNK